MIRNCIMCPLGCELTYSNSIKGELVVTGNNCPRGEQFIRSELTCPMRSISTLVKYNDRVVAVKTSVQIPKTKIQEVLDITAKLKLDKKPKFHTVLIHKIAGTEADLIVTSK